MQTKEAGQAALAEHLAKEARTAAFRAGGGSLLLGDGITDDTLILMPTARNVFCLGLSSTRFSKKVIAATGGGSGAAAAPEMLLVAEEAGRLWIAGCSEQERGWAPRLELESWLDLVHEVELLRVPLLFGRAHADLTLSD